MIGDIYGWNECCRPGKHILKEEFSCKFLILAM